MPLIVNDGGVWKGVTKLFVQSSGLWKAVTGLFTAVETIRGDDGEGGDEDWHTTWSMVFGTPQVPVPHFAPPAPTLSAVNGPGGSVYPLVTFPATIDPTAREWRREIWFYNDHWGWWRDIVITNPDQTGYDRGYWEESDGEGWVKARMCYATDAGRGPFSPESNSIYAIPQT